MLKNKLKDFRREKYINQKGFARIMGVHVNTYRRFENNETELPADYAKKLGDHFNIDWWNFYEDETTGRKKWKVKMTVKDLIYKLMLAHPDAIVKVVASPEDNPGDDILDVVDAKTEVLLEHGKDCDTQKK